ncbi:hypothetical protein GTQ99_00115 [Kineococcus sp. T13]|uniref:RDD family protein n=1 Tax=Kineococcus vitellinus TaxID=2696565 RepID=UPI001412C209|nr:RDD family protein [Kineococcus vitellinus]NAZ73834.1 hypothetical protein [Kineococcus vitellinus]
MSNFLYEPGKLTHQTEHGSSFVHRDGYYRGSKLANVGQRAASGLIDYGPAIVLWIIGWQWRTPTPISPYGFEDSVQAFAAVFGGIVANLIDPGNMILFWTTLIVWFNVAWMQGRTGQSIGKLIVGTRLTYPIVDPHLTSEAYMTFPGVARCTWRSWFLIVDLFLLLVTFVKIGVNDHRKSFADTVAKTIVIGPSERRPLVDMRGAPDR